MAVFVLAHTHIATFVLGVWVTLVGAGVPVVSAGVPTFHPTIVRRAVTITDELTLCIGGVGGTVLGALAVTCF